MEDILDQDSRLSEQNSQDAEMGSQSELQSVGNEDSMLSSSGRVVSKRSTRGKRRTAEQDKKAGESKRGKRFVTLYHYSHLKHI